MKIAQAIRDNAEELAQIEMMDHLLTFRAYRK
jgi:acyl-CoA reductase-like NAD-dependent aldehyde dehydrogenase